MGQTTVGQGRWARDGHEPSESGGGVGGRAKTVQAAAAAGRWRPRRMPAQSPPGTRRASEAGGPTRGEALDPSSTGRFAGEDGAGRAQAGCGAASSPAMGRPQWPVQSVVGSATARVQRRVRDLPPSKVAGIAIWAMARPKQRQNMSQRSRPQRSTDAAKNKRKTKQVTTGPHPNKSHMPLQCPVGNQATHAVPAHALRSFCMAA